MESSVNVDGVPIRYRVTGSGTRDLVLIHGHLANSLWWHAIVPLLEDRYRLVLIDLSGHGDSGHRDVYSVPQWEADVVGVLDDLGSTGAVLAAHSLGGSVAICVAAHDPRVSSVVVFDTLIAGLAEPRPQIPERPQGRAVPYATTAEAISRFRLMPPQPPIDPELVAPIAANSLRAVDGGWTWKFDRSGCLTFDYDIVLDSAKALTVPLLYVYGEHSSVVTAAAAADAEQILPQSTSTFERIPGGHHHLVLDHAVRCAALIEECATPDRYSAKGISG
ncbi:alpha/beta fold hydrolase [Dietzia psychralcaliphila]|uniref:alpha/beta fold hydrolase n=1 Tax=Dietzia psychralcaliphila TaxID=139021 RepID=UPI001C1DD4EC|nr:alpha/beta hydrolase [Dietzia psychralcaliphila]